MKHLASWLTGYSQKAGRGGGGVEEKRGKEGEESWSGLAYPH